LNVFKHQSGHIFFKNRFILSFIQDLEDFSAFKGRVSHGTPPAMPQAVHPTPCPHHPVAGNAGSVREVRQSTRHA